MLLLGLLEESHNSELAALMGCGLMTVQRITASLEDEEVLVGRLIGRTRRLSFNPRYPAVNELKALLKILAIRDQEVDDMASGLRRRPRKRGKEI